MEDAEAELDGADRDVPTGSRLQSTAVKEKPRKRKRAAKEKAEERAEAQEPEAADDDVCAEEPDSEEMVEEELEEAAVALEAEEEEEAKAGGKWSAEKVGARKRVALPSTERRADASEDHFVGEPVPDHEARQRWPERYKTKGPDVVAKRCAEDEELKARCHYRRARFFSIQTLKWLNMAPQGKAQFTKDWDFYYDMSYSVAYSTFANLPAGSCSLVDNDGVSSSEASSISDDAVDSSKETLVSGFHASSDVHTKTTSLLDLYSGCGAMSTGLCLGAVLSNFKLETVRNEKAEDFLVLLKEWDALCKKYIVQKDTILESEVARSLTDDEDEPLSEDTYEVEKLLDICHGDPNSSRKVGLWFKGTVDVICGGPPCQGISGFNRFRSREDPLKDEKNKQLVVFMDIVEYLKPKYVLMENVVNILKFADGFLWEVLPKFPLPTHDVVKRGVVTNAFEVANHQPKDVMDFIVGPKTEFQRYIRLNRKAMMDYSFDGEVDSGEGKLFDHQPLRLNNDDYERVQQIPLKKIILYPSQARVLTIRENARLQSFPDYYRLFGPIKQKYMQVGNAVAVPVARALGCSLGMAYMGRLDGDGPLFKLPKSFTRTPVVFSGGEDADMEQVLD
ncbi:unnamed protein product [Miscanthus lutarioriparius]|uniref:DNA (cytosine-5-)-methyltransferase n=1 Tax=Miscanthus lutarioriparius TaxID=422564 RepID=A0A811M7L8_9POAL|nr:unnamed protein product [Miscanthus lutarioriparius]